MKSKLLAYVYPTDDDLDEDLSENEAPKVKKKKKAKKSSRESKSSKRQRSRREVGLTDASPLMKILLSFFVHFLVVLFFGPNLLYCNAFLRPCCTETLILI